MPLLMHFFYPFCEQKISLRRVFIHHQHSCNTRATRKFQPWRLRAIDFLQGVRGCTPSDLTDPPLHSRPSQLFTTLQMSVSQRAVKSRRARRRNLNTCTQQWIISRLEVDEPRNIYWTSVPTESQPCC